MYISRRKTYISRREIKNSCLCGEVFSLGKCFFYRGWNKTQSGSLFDGGPDWSVLVGVQALLNWSFPTPQMGQTQSSGRSSNAVPGAIPLSGSPTAGSYS